MNVNQQKNLQKIMQAFDKDYRLSEQLYDRQVELIESIRLHFQTVLNFRRCNRQRRSSGSTGGC